MKKILLFCFSLAIVSAAMAQPDVTSAYNANQDGKYEEAAMYIEKAMADPKATAKEKTWRYRGNIYLNIAVTPELAVKYPNAIQLALESFSKAMEMDKDNFNYVSNRDMCDRLAILANNTGIDLYNKGEYTVAANNFTWAEQIGKLFQVTDTLSIYNAALCYDKAGAKDQAIANYLRCGDLGYNVPDVYILATMLESKAGNTEGALKILSEARVKYPKTKELLLEEINIYLAQNRFADAEQHLKTAIEQDPRNEVLHFAQGSVYENLGKMAEAEASYKAALEIKPDYFDALFNLGATYFNRGVEQDKVCNAIPASKVAEYNDCSAKATVEFEKALPLLESAYKADPTDKVAIRSLKEAYTRLERMEDAAKMKALLNE
ncbi:MAG: tetratricopeptide repeat protein [Flavobacteriales bacterium]|nr:tetratricopeptide repeat protein [Flavobacteriales bacterium]